MANKPKEKIPNNLLSIREELKLTQKELGEILNVSVRQICNYETDETSTLPLDKSILISKKWNYSLDYIYCNSTVSKKSNTYYTETEKNNFLVDIRTFFCKEKDNLYFTITNSFWEYLKTKENILSSLNSKKETKRAIAELDANYKVEDKSDIRWEYKLPYDKFISKLHFGDSSTIYATSEESKNKPSPEAVEEVTSFLNFISNHPVIDDEF